VRHLEVQVAGDGQGHAIHLFERECTLQRRHQKVIEEAPSSGLSPRLRAAILADAVKLAAGVNYRGLGTVEFVVTGEEHYFLEVNPRLQVEHPVTEEVTGLDLVELQLRIADTGILPLTQADVQCSGHAFEARLCAEDAAAGFLPATGRLQVVDFSRAGVRIESGVDSGDDISPHYDSMIAKLIAHGPDRESARRALVAGLRESTVIGLVTNLEFLHELLEWPETRNATFHTRLIDERHAQRGVVAPAAPPLEHLAAAALHWLAQRRAELPALGCWTLWDGFTGWRLSTGPIQAAPQPVLVLKAGAEEWPVRFSMRDDQGRHALVIGEQKVNATLQPLAAGRFLLQCGGRALELTIRGDAGQVELASALGSSVFTAQPYLGGGAGDAAASGQLGAPMMGKVVAVKSAVGEKVAIGQTVIVLESMKMELHVTAPFEGSLSSLRCRVGDMVERHQVLAEVSPA
jgi:3-methylcrotonyl-CoA carboxylase alpha subunit